jgi:hypothetical protein
MKRIIASLTDWQKVLIYLIPVFYFITGAYFKTLLGNYSLRCFDPEYIYFMSGLTISDGVIKVGHIDNPGTPLQLFVALVFKIVYFIRSSQLPYLDDVLTHPDLYLSVVNLAITLISSFVLFVVGNLVFKYTKNILMGMVVQTAPFLPLIWYDLIGRIVPELIMLFPVVLITLIIIKIHTEDQPGISLKNVLLLALLAGFGLSVKLSFIPIWIIPFIVIPKWKNKLIFIGSAILSFLIIAYPVTLQMGNFWSWTKNLVTHSGNYGSGEANFIDPAIFKANIKEILNLEKRYFVILLALAVCLIGYVIYYRKKSNTTLVLASLAILAAAVFQLFMVGKHFAHRYFIPILMFSPLIVYLIAQMVQAVTKKLKVNIVVYVLLFGYLLWSFNYNKKWFQHKTIAMEEDITRRGATWHFAQTLEKDSYKIITSQNYGCPFIEYTLFYSQVWANYEKRVEYNDVLGRLYPTAYSYFTFSDEMKYWKQKLNTDSIVASGKKTYLYIENDQQELFDKTLAKIHAEDTTNFKIQSQLLFRNPETTEVIYQLSFSDLQNEKGDSTNTGIIP